MFDEYVKHCCEFRELKAGHESCMRYWKVSQDLKYALRSCEC
jgi:hypothetical protein